MQTIFWGIVIFYLTFWVRQEAGDARKYKEIAFLVFTTFSFMFPLYKKYSDTLFSLIIFVALAIIIRPMNHPGMVWKSMTGLMSVVLLYRIYLSRKLLDKSRLKDILALTCIGQAIWLLVNWVGYDPVYFLGIIRRGNGGELVEAGKMTLAGSLDNPMVSANHLAMVFPFLFRRKWIWFIPLCLLGVGITKSATGILGCGMAIAAYLFINKEYRVLFILGLVGGIFACFLPIREFLSTSGRALAWIRTLEVWLNMDSLDKLFGAGPGIYKFKVKRVLGIRPYFTHPHNEYISILFQYGIVGLLATGMVIKNALKGTDIHFKSSFCVLLLTMCSAFPLHIAATGLIAIIVTAYCIDFE